MGWAPETPTFTQESAPPHPQGTRSQDVCQDFTVRRSEDLGVPRSWELCGLHREALGEMGLRVPPPTDCLSSAGRFMSSVPQLLVHRMEAP